MKKNRKKSYEKLMLSRNNDLFFLYGDQPLTEVVVNRLMTFKGIKRFFYTLMFIVENEVTNKDVYRVEFEFSMSQWMADKVSSTELENRATKILTEELKIVDNPNDYIPFEEVK